MRRRCTATPTRCDRTRGHRYVSGKRIYQTRAAAEGDAIVERNAAIAPPGDQNDVHVPPYITPPPQPLPEQGQQFQPASFWPHPEMVAAVADLARKVSEMLEKKWQHELRAESTRAKWGSGGSAALVVLIVGAVC